MRIQLEMGLREEAERTGRKALAIDPDLGSVHIALDDGRGPQAISYTFAQSRAAIKRRAVTTALFVLRRALLAR